MKKNARKPVEKKVYAKPAIHRVELHPEESMAAGCKMTTGGTASSASPCTLNTCFADGS